MVLLVVPMVTVVVDEIVVTVGIPAEKHVEVAQANIAPPSGEGEGLTARTRTTGRFTTSCWIASAFMSQNVSDIPVPPFHPIVVEDWVEETIAYSSPVAPLSATNILNPVAALHT